MTVNVQCTPIVTARSLTLKVLVKRIDALRHFETG